MHPNSIRKVIEGFNGQGINSITPKPRSGRPPKFDTVCCNRIIETVRHKPAEFGIESGVWGLFAPSVSVTRIMPTYTEGEWEGQGNTCFFALRGFFETAQNPSALCTV